MIDPYLTFELSKIIIKNSKHIKFVFGTVPLNRKLFADFDLSWDTNTSGCRDYSKSLFSQSFLTVGIVANLIGTRLFWRGYKSRRLIALSKNVGMVKIFSSVYYNEIERTMHNIFNQYPKT